MALLRLFIAIRQEYRLKLVCCHFNHGLRPEADAEECFVEGVCKELAVPFVSSKKYVAEHYQGDSLEQAARELRFDFFLACGRQFRIKKLALAHHKDDLAETVLMRLIRGSGLKGLQGFLPLSRYRSLTVIRPLIEAGKQDILAWLAACGAEYRVDASNDEEIFLRNKIRKKLVPLLREMNPDIITTLAQTARLIGQDYTYINTAGTRAYAALKKGETRTGVRLMLKGLQALDAALFGYVIRQAVEDVKGTTRRFELRHIDEIRDLVYNRPTGSIVDVPDIRVFKDDAHVRIEPAVMRAGKK